MQRFAIDGVPAVALGEYDGALRRAIVAMKRGERDPVAAFAALFDGVPFDGVFVPVPTTWARAAERGFDQSVALARRLALRRGAVCAEVLVKRWGRPQEGAGRRERLAAVGRFRVRDGVVLPRAVTLIDDVCTTGATLRDAVRTLRAAGVVVEGAVVVARRSGTPARSAWS